MKSFNIRNSLGLSLIEVMVVLTIVVLVISVGFSQFQNRSRTLKSKVKDFTNLGKQVRARARLTGFVHRIVLDFGLKEEGQEDQYYWVETGSSADLLADQEFVKNIEQEKEEEENQEEEDEKKEKDFTLTESLLKEPVKLSRNLRFQSLELAHQQEAIVEGKAYIYFFPTGLIEEAALHIRLGEGLNWTIFFQPYTGRVETIKKHLSLANFKSNQ